MVQVIFKYFTWVELLANSNFGRLRPSLWVLGMSLHTRIIPSWMGVLGEWSRLFYSILSLGGLKKGLCVVWSTAKLQNSPEISWFAWVFLVALCCVVYRHFTMEKMPELWWSVWTRKHWAALPHELLQDWSLIWSIYIPFWLTYLHSSSLSKQNSSSDLLKLAVTGNFGFIRDFTNKFLSSFRKNEWSESKNHRFSQFFPVTWRSTEDYLFEERRQMKIFCRKQVCKCFIWVTNWGTSHGERKCCQIFSCPDRPSKLRHFSMVKCLQTTQNQPKNSCKTADWSWLIDWSWKQRDS